MPMNFLLIEALDRLDGFYGANLARPFPAKSHHAATAHEAAISICNRTASLFLPDLQGDRPCHEKQPKFQLGKEWGQLIHYYEYFHPETGRGIGASHQTGWTSLVVNCLFRVGEERARLRERIDDHFVENNWNKFSETFWDLPSNADAALAHEVVVGGFRTIQEMMRVLYERQPWRYRDLMLSYGSRHHSKGRIDSD